MLISYVIQPPPHFIPLLKQSLKNESWGFKFFLNISTLFDTLCSEIDPPQPPHSLFYLRDKITYLDSNYMKLSLVYEHSNLPSR